MGKKRHTVPAKTYQRVGARLWELRASRLLTMADLAQALRCSRSMISQVERGACLPSMERLTRWAEALGAEAEVQPLLALLQEDAQVAQQAGHRVRARLLINRPRSA